jgi:hypothetical protein
MTEPCLHLVTENGACVACGQLWDNPRWTMEELRKELDNQDSKVFTSEWSGIPAISKLADDTWAEYDRRATANEDPQRPQMPRMRLIGQRLMRIPFHQIFKEVVGPSYEAAMLLGYLGSYSSWCRLVKESNRT